MRNVRRTNTMAIGVRPLAFVVLALIGSGDTSSVKEFQSQAVRAQNDGDYATAEEFLRKALKAITEIPDFPPNERARQMSNLASVLNLAGKPDDALDLVLPAAVILQQHSSDDPGQYIVLDLNTVRAYALLKRYDEALLLCRRALARVDDANAMGTMYGAEAKAAHAYVLLKTGEYREAIAAYEFAMNFWKSRLSENLPLRQNLREELGEARSLALRNQPSN